MPRVYRIPGARVSLLSDRLLVQFRSGPMVSVTAGEEDPAGYLGEGPVWIRVDDTTGAWPTVSGELPNLDDDFGVVLTEIEFRGNAHAEVDEETGALVVTANGTPTVVGGNDRFPLDPAQLEAAGSLTWACTDPTPVPHRP